ncbi:MAG: restriction endonuclease subunit S [Desulfuromonadales bacterium]|nr:restriction endonuclease subunit S [Desulfuromonadales bacterium]
MEVMLGYKQTEMGIIPEDWTVTTVGQLVHDGVLEKPLDGNHGNIHPKSGDFVSFGIPFVMANNIRGGRVDLNSCSFIRKEQADSLQKGFSIPGDVLLTHKATIGNTAVVDEIPFEYIMLTPQVTYYRVSDLKSLSNFYLRHFFDSPTFQRVLISMSGGGTRSYIGITAQLQLPIVLPPARKEQEAIATALSDVDALITSLDKLIAKKYAIKTATMQQLLTGKKRLPGFSGEWEMKVLGDVASFHKGKGLAKSELDPHGSEPCIHYGELFTRHPETISTILSWTNSTSGVFRSVANDVLMPTSDVTPTGLAKASCVLQSGIVLGGDILVIRTDPKELSGSFLSYTIRQSRDRVMQLVTGTTVFHLYGSDMQKFEFLMPVLEEQQAIVEVLSDMAAEVTALESRRDKTKAIKQGMMQELLTGRTRLI